MYNESYWTDHPEPSPTLRLDRIWEVDADAGYDVRRAPPWPSGFVLLRTRLGRGRLALRSGAAMVVEADTLAWFDHGQVSHYWCDGARWSFWWLICHGDAPRLPAESVLSMPAGAAEDMALRRCCELLLRQTPEACRAASAQAGAIVQDWALRWADRDGAETADQARVRRVLDRMRATLDDPLPLAVLAREAGVGERRLRDLFSNNLGQSPKQAYDDLRLTTAAEWLRIGALTVGQIADRLGYSSPYHFSRAFRRRFGSPPSHHRPGGRRRRR